MILKKRPTTTTTTTTEFDPSTQTPISRPYYQTKKTEKHIINLFYKYKDQ